jgi:para-nitrobenzyl esterase
MQKTTILVVLMLVACRRHARHDDELPAPQAKLMGTAATGVVACAKTDVVTHAGCVRGQSGAIEAFRGIPYAAPPVGPLRWKPPRPAAPWKDVRSATAFGKACPQGDDTIGGKLDWDEDCLTLNVWTPNRTGKLPVMVWIHGGGLVQGGSSLPFYDGSHLAADGKLVVVSFNYRLGPLGFLALPALTAESPDHASGNFGLLDQIAALHWVQDNIAAFGGDPARVTIFGESAGGESVCALMASPLAKGLFGRGIIESAQCAGYGKALRALHEPKGKTESGEAQGERIAKALGCSDLACMRGKRADELIHASPAAFGFLGKGEHYGFTVDGHALADAPAALLEAGKLPEIPMLVGTTADEATLFTAKIPMRGPLAYDLVVKRIFAANAPKVLAQYPAAGNAKQAFDALVTDVVFTCPTRRAAKAMRTKQSHVYRYVFAHVTDKARAKGMGASHGSEVPFVFGTLDSSATDGERKLARTMLGYWAHFAQFGDPNGGGAPAWPAYDAASDAYLELDAPIAAKRGMHTAGCDVLDGVAADVEHEE